TPILLAVAAVAVASALVAGCSRRPPPPLPARRLDCPPPMLWRAGGPRPPLVPVVKHSADSVGGFPGDCMAGTRVGDVGPGRTRLFALPKELIAHEDGLRVHVVRGAGTVNPDVTLMAIALDTARVLHLEVPKESPSCPVEVFVNGLP